MWRLSAFAPCTQIKEPSNIKPRIYFSSEAVKGARVQSNRSVPAGNRDKLFLILIIHGNGLRSLYLCVCACVCVCVICVFLVVCVCVCARAFLHAFVSGFYFPAYMNASRWMHRRPRPWHLTLQRTAGHVHRP